MKYTIKARDKLGIGFEELTGGTKAVISEFSDSTSARTLRFNSMEDAEAYAKKNGMKDYEVIPL